MPITQNRMFALITAADEAQRAFEAATQALYDLIPADRREQALTIIARLRPTPEDLRAVATEQEHFRLRAADNERRRRYMATRRERQGGDNGQGKGQGKAQTYDPIPSIDAQAVGFTSNEEVADLLAIERVLAKNTAPRQEPSSAPTTPSTDQAPDTSHKDFSGELPESGTISPGEPGKVF